VEDSLVACPNFYTYTVCKSILVSRYAEIQEVCMMMKKKV